MRIDFRHSFMAGLATLLLAAGACGGGHDDHGGGDANRTIDVEMRDIAYEPTTLSVQAGETVKFVFRNTGQAVHDAFIGDEAAQAEHEKEMREAEGGHHDGEHAITVEPGKTASLTYTFERAGSLLIGCHQPGHYTAGMKVSLTVA